MFNKETEYALRGLVYIQIQNSRNHRPGIAEIAREIEAPAFYTAKIMQRMVRYGFIASIKGKGGGFYFPAENQNLPLYNIITAIQGDRLFTGCAFGLKQCSEQNPCPMHDRYAPIREAIYRLVSEETIQSLAERFSGITDSQ
jgi:Rrf2 family protein